ncbi:hypothetical protein [Flagellimonas algicola]|uniref:Uncharacterized protein n=1 Tax=Flagellimonas algicola TaxID=2583815 RepID=A0ABY2WGJ7_9FLAO|nr:hypothetical protein [Allomuricauda algicola]TMU50680.1 hypothetical protein FGG15_17925 [Allomuricauda algicola]
MKSKRIIFPVFFIVFLLIWRCGGSNLSGKNQDFPTYFEHGRDIVYHLDHLFPKLAALDSMDFDFGESTSLVNEQIRKTMERIRTPKLLEEVAASYVAGRHLFHFTYSEDGKIGVFSWDSRMLLADTSIKNLALYTTYDKVIPTSLYGSSIIYDQIYSLGRGKPTPVYAFRGKGRQHNSFYRMDAYVIQNGSLDLAPIFPDRKSSLFSDLDEGNIHSEAELDFNIEMDGTLILKPEVWGPTLAYRPMQWEKSDGDANFSETLWPLSRDISNEDFDPSNPYGFLNGSEMPISNEDGSFVFSNELTIDVMGRGNGTLYSISIHNTDAIKISFDEPVVLAGKKNDFLFFLARDNSSNGNLYLYDLNKQKMRWVKRMSKALILENTLLFAELTDKFLIPNIDEIECDPAHVLDRGFFKVYAVDYDNLNPIVEYTDQTFCGSKKNSRLVDLIR